MNKNKGLLKQALEQDKLLKLNAKLWFAVENNQLQQAKNFLGQGATLHKITGVPLRRYDLSENTLLHIAAKYGFLELVKFLVEYGTIVDARNRLKQTPLQWAAYYGHLDIVKYLISQGADINSIDVDGDPALTWAANKGQQAVVEYLIAQGADPNKVSPQGNTALHWVAIAGEMNMAKYLIDLGCNPNLQNNQEKTPLDLAIENANTGIVMLLMDYVK